MTGIYGGINETHESAGFTTQVCFSQIIIRNFVNKKFWSRNTLNKLGFGLKSKSRPKQNLKMRIIRIFPFMIKKNETFFWPQSPSILCINAMKDRRWSYEVTLRPSRTSWTRRSVRSLKTRGSWHRHNMRLILQTVHIKYSVQNSHRHSADHR